MLRPAVGEIVAVDRGHHDVGEPEPGGGVADPRWLSRVERPRQAGAHVAEGAGAGAGVAHDHEGRVLLLPAFTDVGAVRLNAYGVKAVRAHDAARLCIARRARRLDPNPIGLL